MEVKLKYESWYEIGIITALLTYAVWIIGYGYISCLCAGNWRPNFNPVSMFMNKCFIFSSFSLLLLPLIFFRKDCTNKDLLIANFLTLYTAFIYCISGLYLMGELKQFFTLSMRMLIIAIITLSSLFFLSLIAMNGHKDISFRRKLGIILIGTHFFLAITKCSVLFFIT